MKQELESYFDRLWPICRSLSGDGNRETLKILSEIVDLNISEIRSGTVCFDWVVPPEWNAKEAWIKDSHGNTIVDFKNNNLHLLGYSIPFKGRMNLSELKSHFYTLPEQPDLIPYQTSYYEERWGFCITHNQLVSLEDGEYEVCIDSSLNPKGSMTIADALIKGETEEEVLFSTYICHPSMASNELSGPLVSSFLYQALKTKKLRYTYRFVFVPETIGSIYYLSRYGNHLKEKLVAGFVITTIGDDGKFTYKKTRRGNALPDRATELVLKQQEKGYTIEDFFPTGSDERQYCSPGFDLPVGSLMRTRYGKYKEYHTSGDNKDFICFDAIQRSIDTYADIIGLMEANHKYTNKIPFCEPQLGKRGLYPTMISPKEKGDFVSVMMWLHNLSDGTNDLIDIANRSNAPYKFLIDIAGQLLSKNLLELNDETNR